MQACCHCTRTGNEDERDKELARLCVLRAALLLVAAAAAALREAAAVSETEQQVQDDYPEGASTGGDGIVHDRTREFEVLVVGVEVRAAARESVHRLDGSGGRPLGWRVNSGHGEGRGQCSVRA